MDIRRHIDGYNFMADRQSGITLRWGKTFDDNPLIAPWPELADISISNRCSKGCSFCYRDSGENGELLSLEDYRYIIKDITHPQYGPVFQVALGGGEPLEHPDFAEIIDITWKSGIVPNFTTNGDYLSHTILKKIAGKIGAVALSVTNLQSDISDKILLLHTYGIRVNLHFILNAESIDMAIQFLKGTYDVLLRDINAVVFLTYKSAGRAGKELCIKPGQLLDDFLVLVSKPLTGVRYGFDACFVPLLLQKTTIDPVWIDSCECSFFSVYIDEKMNVKPCSFSSDKSFTFNMKEKSFQYIWTEGFNEYRKTIIENTCQISCSKKDLCRGNCLFFPELQLCCY